MTYNVFGGTLSLAQSINLSSSFQIINRRHIMTDIGSSWSTVIIIDFTSLHPIFPCYIHLTVSRVASSNCFPCSIWRLDRGQNFS